MWHLTSWRKWAVVWKEDPGWVGDAEIQGRREWEVQRVYCATGSVLGVVQKRYVPCFCQLVITNCDKHHSKFSISSLMGLESVTLSPCETIGPTGIPSAVKTVVGPTQVTSFPLVSMYARPGWKFASVDWRAAMGVFPLKMALIGRAVESSGGKSLMVVGTGAVVGVSMVEYEKG